MSPYRGSALDVVQFFAFSEGRKSILRGWLLHRKALRAIGFGTGFQWIDGSFVEKAKEPKDIDTMTFLRRPPHARTLHDLGLFWQANRPVLGRAQVKASYRFEAFATKRERDAHCGPTAYQDVRYAPATSKDLRSNDITIDRIACGHDIDHPMFEAVVSPLFDAAFRRLIGAAIEAPKATDGVIAESEIIIARVRYSIKAESAGGWIKFPVSAIVAFETGDQELIDRTVDWLAYRIELTASPSLFDARPS